VKSPLQLNVGAFSKVKISLADPVFEEHILAKQSLDNQNSNEVSIIKNVAFANKEDEKEENKKILNDTEDFLTQTQINDEANSRGEALFVKPTEQESMIDTMNLKPATKEINEIAVNYDGSTEDFTNPTTTIKNNDSSFSSIDYKTISQENERVIPMTQNVSEDWEISNKPKENEDKIDSKSIDFGEIEEI